MAKQTLKASLQMRHDTEANWLAVSETFIPLAGEFCVTMDGENKGHFKIGDGTSTWGQLNYAGSDQTLLAQSVMFDSDMVFTENFGKYKVLGGKVTIPSKDKTLYEVLLDAYSEDKNPTVTQPSVSVSSTTAKSYEVGTTVKPAYSGSFNAGSYTYGPATGCTVSSWSATNNTTDETLTTQSGTFADYVVTDDSNYIITISGTYGDGAMPVTALGAEYAEGQIKGATKTASTSAITGYRSFFYGVLDTSSEEAPLTSAIVRGLTNGGAYNSSKTLTVNGTSTAKRIVVAIPSASITGSRTGVKEVILTSAMNTPVTDSYTKTVDAVAVQGVNSATAVNYTVWVYEPASIDAGEVHQIKLA